LLAATNSPNERRQRPRSKYLGWMRVSKSCRSLCVPGLCHAERRIEECEAVLIPQSKIPQSKHPYPTREP
jgi:hypothetical protein